MANNKRKHQGTSTSSFGTLGRINHDSSKFYNSRLYDGLNRDNKPKFIENEVPKKFLNKIFCKSSEQMNEIPSNSIHLMITSPPYNVTKEYDQNLSLSEYRRFLKKVWEETYRVLVPGGRACINVANLGRKPYIPLHSFIIEDCFNLGFLMRGEIIWNKSSSASPSTAWGSWLSAANPVLRDIHEYILVFSKESFNRPRKNKDSSISKDQFLEWTKSVWSFPAVSAQKIGHPAPFPDELPHRLVQLYTYKRDIVLDPFVGSGTTCLAALRGNRYYIGYEINSNYIRLAEERISALINQTELFSSSE